jgi:hypothetical protein
MYAFQLPLRVGTLHQQIHLPLPHKMDLVHSCEAHYQQSRWRTANLVHQVLPHFVEPHLFNDKLVILLHETRIWLMEALVSTTHGGKLFG